MKYSQGFLIACVGGAAIVSAIPTLVDGDADLSARNTPQSTVPRKSRSTKHGNRLGKLIKFGGTFAQHANPNQMNQLDQTEFYPRGIFSSIVKVASKPKVRKAASSLKRTGKTAVKAAGGGHAVAQNLGAIAGMVMGQNSYQPDVYGRDLPDEPSSGETSPNAAVPNAQAIVGMGGKTGGRKDKAARKKKWKGMSAEEKAKFKAERKTRKHDKAVAAASSAGSVPSVPSPTFTVRDLDELDLRDLYFMVANLKSRESSEEEFSTRDFEINELD